ncbi:MAG: hypothetical protein ACREIW_07110, partial [Chthoniobacterales bacterium]
MAKETRMPKLETTSGLSEGFDIRASSFVRHSTFGFRHSYRGFWQKARGANSAFPIQPSSIYKHGMSLNIDILSKAATQARGLCMDAV